jgi:V/A-type H+-transporting ATPase subunit A
MRQRFIDWNYTEFGSESFKKSESDIDALYSEGSGKLGLDAELLLKGGE